MHCDPGLAHSICDRILLEASCLALLDIVAVGVAVARDVASDYSQIFRVGPVLHDGLERSPNSLLAVNFIAPFLAGLVAVVSVKVREPPSVTGLTIADYFLNFFAISSDIAPKGCQVSCVTAGLHLLMDFRPDFLVKFLT